MTTANKITLTRIAMIPFFIYFAAQPMLNVEEYKVGIFSFPTCTLIALILFCVASFTDFLDGYVARKYNQVTDFGKFVDPLADKLLVSSALILFVEQKAMAGWMVCVILARELIITSLRVVAANKGVVMAATWTGKVKTCVQIGYHHYLPALHHLWRCGGWRECAVLDFRCPHGRRSGADRCRLGGNAGYYLLRL